MSKPSIKKLTTAKAEAETCRRAGEIEDLLLPSRGIESIASLAGLSKLRKLDLSQCQIGPEQAAVVAEFLGLNRSLVELRCALLLLFHTSLSNLS